MNTEQAIETLIGFSAIMTSEDSINAFEMALSALRAQQERENPKPLTLEQLKERVGGWVFVEPIENRPEYNRGWGIVSDLGVDTPTNFYGIGTFGSTVNAYDHEPKEATNEY